MPLLPLFVALCGAVLALLCLRVRWSRIALLLLAVSCLGAIGVSQKYIQFSLDCTAEVATGAYVGCFDMPTTKFFYRDGSVYLDPDTGGGGDTPTLEEARAEGNALTGAVSAATALHICRTGTANCTDAAHWVLYVDATNEGRIEFYDAAGNLATEAKAIYSGSSWVISIDTAGTQQTCLTVSDAGVLTFAAQESCGTLTGIAHLEFAEDDGTHTCAAGNYGIWGDNSEDKLKACQNGVLSDLVGGGGSGDIEAVGDCASGACFGTVTSTHAFMGGTPAAFRALADSDIPDTITCSNYQPLDAALTALAGGSDFVTFSGPATSTKTFTLPNASATLLSTNAAVTVAQGGTGLASGTSGGVPYFSGSTTVASSAALTVNGVLIGGGAGAAPTSIAASTTTTHGLFATAGAPAFRALADADVPDTVTASNYLPLAGGTLTGQLVTDNLGIEAEESDTNPTCAAGNYNIYADASETKWKKCTNGVASDLAPAATTDTVEYPFFFSGEDALATPLYATASNTSLATEFLSADTLTPNTTRYVVPASITVNKLCGFWSALAAATTYTITVRKNGVNQACALAMTNADIEVCAACTAVNFVAEDQMSLEVGDSTGNDTTNKLRATILGIGTR